MNRTLFTIGHSNLTMPAFLDLLRENEINAIADVRSQPYSRLYPQFNRDLLEFTLKQANIQYSFLGKELGARSTDKHCYAQGRISYDLLAATPLFSQGLHRVQSGLARGFRMALLCAERDPLQCHRSILIARHLEERGVTVQHILEPGVVEPHRQTVERLMQKLSLGSLHLFKNETELRDMAYDIQGNRIAFVPEDEPVEMRS